MQQYLKKDTSAGGHLPRMQSDRSMPHGGDDLNPFQMKIKNQNPFGSFAMPKQSKEYLYPSVKKMNASSGVEQEVLTSNEASLPKIKNVLVSPRKSHAILEKYNRFKSIKAKASPFASAVKSARKASH